MVASIIGILALALMACTQQPPPLIRLTPTPTLVLPTATPTPIPTPTPVPTPTPTPDPVLGRLRLELREAFPLLPDFAEAREAVPNLPDTKLSLLTHLTHAGDGTNRLWVTVKAGIVYVFDNKPDVESFTQFERLAYFR